MTQTKPNAGKDPIVLIEDHKTSCDGGGGVHGHPLVWYEFGAAGESVCEYCGIHYVQKGGAADPEH